MARLHFSFISYIIIHCVSMSHTTPCSSDQSVDNLPVGKNAEPSQESHLLFPDITQSPATSFTRFKELPVELRTLIVDQVSMQDRFVFCWTAHHLLPASHQYDLTNTLFVPAAVSPEQVKKYVDSQVPRLQSVSTIVFQGPHSVPSFIAGMNCTSHFSFPKLQNLHYLPIPSIMNKHVATNFKPYESIRSFAKWYVYDKSTHQSLFPVAEDSHLEVSSNDLSGSPEYSYNFETNSWSKQTKLDLEHCFGDPQGITDEILTEHRHFVNATLDLLLWPGCQGSSSIIFTGCQGSELQNQIYNFFKRPAYYNMCTTATEKETGSDWLRISYSISKVT